MFTTLYDADEENKAILTSLDADNKKGGVRFKSMRDVDNDDDSSHSINSDVAVAKKDNKIVTGKSLLARKKSKEREDDRMSELASVRERTIDEMKIQTMYKVCSGYFFKRVVLVNIFPFIFIDG